MGKKAVQKFFCCLINQAKTKKPGNQGKKRRGHCRAFAFYSKTRGETLKETGGDYGRKPKKKDKLNVRERLDRPIRGKNY